MSQHDVSPAARAPWTAPILEELTVDLEAIAGKGGKQPDGKSGNTGPS